jgi:hypothetical protein
MIGLGIHERPSLLSHDEAIAIESPWYGDVTPYSLVDETGQPVGEEIGVEVALRKTISGSTVIASWIEYEHYGRGRRFEKALRRETKSVASYIATASKAKREGTISS